MFCWSLACLLACSQIFRSMDHRQSQSRRPSSGSSEELLISGGDEDISARLDLKAPEWPRPRGITPPLGLWIGGVPICGLFGVNKTPTKVETLGRDLWFSFVSLWSRTPRHHETSSSVMSSCPTPQNPTGTGPALWSCWVPLNVFRSRIPAPIPAVRIICR